MSKRIYNILDALASRNSLTYVNTKANVSVSSAVWTSLESVSLSAGIYLLTGSVDFGSNSDGIRILLMDTENTTTNKVSNSVLATGRAVLNMTRVIQLTSAATLYVKAYQTSGSTASTSSKLSVLKLA